MQQKFVLIDQDQHSEVTIEQKKTTQKIEPKPLVIVERTPKNGKEQTARMPRNVTKAEFLQRKLKEGVSRPEALRRWKQKQMSQRTTQPIRQRARRAQTQTVAKRGNRGRSSPARLPRSFSRLSLSGARRLSAGASAVVRMLTGFDTVPVRVQNMAGGGPPTAIFVTRSVYDLTCCTVSGDAEGRFAAVFAPKLGQPDAVPTGYEAVDTYANYLVDTDSEYPTNSWRDTSNYESGNNLGSSILQVDGSSIVAGPTPSFVVVSSGGSETAANPLGTAPTQAGNSPPSFKPRITAETADNYIYLPKGRWLCILKTGGTTLSAVTVTASTATVVGASGLALVVNAAATQMVIGLDCTVDSEGEYLAINVTAATVVSSTLYINTWAEDTVTDGGPLKTVRPVSMQVLASYVGPALEGGGNISACLLPQSGLRDLALSDSSGVASPGDPWHWENLARYNEKHRIYTGRLFDGCYAWWVPDDVKNMDFQTPTEMSVVDYPCIAVSGDYVLSAGADPGGDKVVRVIVQRTFEYTTAAQAFSARTPEVPWADYVTALQFLQEQPRVMANDQHTKWYDSFKTNLDDAYLTASEQLPKWVSLAARVKSSIMPFM